MGIIKRRVLLIPATFCSGSCPPTHTHLCYLFIPLCACFSSWSKSRSSNLLRAGDKSASLFASKKNRPTVISNNFNKKATLNDTTSFKKKKYFFLHYSREGSCAWIFVGLITYFYSQHSPNNIRWSPYFFVSLEK